MLAIYTREMKSYIKTLLIWVICVSGLGLMCILMYSGMQEEMAEMADGFASMGAFSEAFGMSQLSLATLIGFYATEIGNIHGLGGAMFAAIIGTALLSKEEDGHTSEFLFTLPISRGKVVVAKCLSAVSLVTIFNVVSVMVYVLGFIIVGEEIPTEEFVLFHVMQLVMQLQIAIVCFAISAFMKKNKFGIGLGVALLFYAYDMIARVIPDISDSKFLSPYSYANAADILSGVEIYKTGLIVGIVMMVVCLGISYVIYTRRDLAA